MADSIYNFWRENSKTVDFHFNAQFSDLFKLQGTPLGVCKQKWCHLAAASGISKDLLQHSLGGITGGIVPGGAEFGSPS